MTPAALQSWRARMGWTAKRAAQELGLSQNGYAAYERGWVSAKLTDGHDRPWQDRESPRRWPRPIPRHVDLACAQLEHRQENALKSAMIFEHDNPYNHGCRCDACGAMMRQFPSHGTSS